MTHLDARRLLLERLYEAFNRQDIDTVVDQLHPRVDWPDVLANGRLTGREAVRRYWQDQFKLIRTEVAPLGYSPTDDGRVVVHTLQVVFNLDGQRWSEGRVDHTYAFDDADLITRMDIS